MRSQARVPDEGAVASAPPAAAADRGRERWLGARRAACLVLAVGAVVIARLAPADEDAEDRRPGRETAPIGAVLERVARDHPGQVLKVELEHDEDAASDWGYEVKVLTGAGHVLELKLDAVSLEVYEVEGVSGEGAFDD